jgi:alcohol dehydrogenase class IV
VEASLKQAGLSYVVFAGVTPNPKDFEVIAGEALYRKEQCDVIVAVGGGSPIDCAKGIGIVASNERPIGQFEGVDQVGIPGPPLVCIPTTAGTSADVSQFAIITDPARKVKMAFVSKALVPDVALIDPETTTTMTAELTAATGMDALVHAIEAFVSNASSPVTDLQALEAIRLVAAHLKRAISHPLDMRCREPMMLGSLLAGMAFSNTSLGLTHAMAHSLGGCLDLPHGDSNAALLEHVVAFNFESASARYVRVGEALGLRMGGLSPADQKARLVEAIASLKREVGLAQTLKHWGVKRADLRQLAENAVNDPCLATNPVQASVQQIEQIYEQAL